LAQTLQILSADIIDAGFRIYDCLLMLALPVHAAAECM
jgi:hypothetical protein